MEPNWVELERRLARMTMKQLRPIGKRWFNGDMGGAGAKAEYVQTMCSQMRYWWRSCVEMGGRERVEKVLQMIAEMEGEH